MKKILLILLIFCGGCAWWQAGISDPTIVDTSIQQATTYKRIGEATGIPYASMALGSLAVLLGILFRGRKKIK